MIQYLNNYIVNPIWRQYIGIIYFKFYFINNFVHRSNFKNLSDSFSKVYAGYRTAGVRPRYKIALKNSTLCTHQKNVISINKILDLESRQAFFRLNLYAKYIFMPNIHLCQMYLYAKCTFMSNVPLCQMYLYVKCTFMSNVPLCQMYLYVKCTFMSNVTLCQVYLYVK